MVVQASTPGNMSYNGLAQTPPMGWNNWNAFGCYVNNRLLETTSNLLVKYGLRDAGYQYVVVDDCWSSHRDDDSQTLVADSVRFPQGMKSIADYIHHNSMKFGIYSSAGLYTCAGYPGSLGYESIDAHTFAEWGVDFLKYDNCYNNGQSGNPSISHRRYNIMSQALRSTNRPIVYSLCNWGEDNAWSWAPTISNSWRMSGDISDNYDRADARCPCAPDNLRCPLTGFHCSMAHILTKASYLTAKAQPGAWLDLDMLEVGNGGMTQNEYKTHFSMWAAMKSPLMIGTDLENLHADDLAIYLNPAVIAVNQDPLGESINLVWRNRVIDGQTVHVSLWSGRLFNGDQIVAVVNQDRVERHVTISLADIFSDEPRKARTMNWAVHDLWGPSRLNASSLHEIMSSDSLNGSRFPESYYNATAKSYSEGVIEKDRRLIGDKIFEFGPAGQRSVSIPAHGIGFYRLRSIETFLV